MEKSPQPSTELVTNTALIPVPKLEQDAYDWHERHQYVLDRGKEIDPTIVLIGDSITHFWGGRHSFDRRGLSSLGRSSHGSENRLEALFFRIPPSSAKPNVF